MLLENPYQQHLVKSDLNESCRLDGLKPKNRETLRFMFLLDCKYRNWDLIDGEREFYVLIPREFEFLQALYFSYHAEKPYFVEYRGNFFTADIYLNSYPFIDFKQIFIKRDC